MYHYVYKITNNINGKIYFGLHSSDHLNDCYMGSGVALKSAFDKYSIENFSKEIIYFGFSREAVSDLEASIVTENFCKSKNNYNLRTGGDESYAHHPETKDKMKGPRGKINITPEHRQQKREIMLTSNPMNSQENRDKVAESKKGISRSQECKDKVSATLTGKYPAFLNNRVKNNPDLIKKWLLLDQIYNKYNQGLRYNTLCNAFECFPRPSSMRSMLHYIKEKGDPRKDPFWLQFKSDNAQ